MSIISGKTVLITGGTGSFGHKVATYLAEQNPKRIIIFSRDEKKQFEMEKDFPDYQYILGDIRDYHRISWALRGVDFVFHAAALKQVPSCEVAPIEAVKTNILGSNNVCDAAIERGVETLVALSTDKAVKPVNTMGISKSMMEKIVCSKNQQKIDTRFACVRYGNVLGSRGSVVPFFKKQLDKGFVLPITSPTMTRFMMTLDEAVRLVFYALSKAKGGEIYVKKSPALKVIDLAHSMIKKYGDGDISKINIVGTRPGEKIDEVLVNEYEIRRSVESDDFFEIVPEYLEVPVNNNYPEAYEYTSANTRQLTEYEDISELLDRIEGQKTYG